MLRRLSKDLTYRLTAIFTLGCLIPIIVSAIYIYIISIRNSTEQSAELAIENVRIREYYVTSWIEDRICDVENLASIHTIYHMDQGKSAQLFATFVERNDDFSEVFIMDKENGKVLFSTHENSVGKVKLNRTYFERGVNASYASQIYFSPSLNAPAMTITTPLGNLEGQNIGVLGARVNLDRLISTLGMPCAHDHTVNAYIVNKWNAFVLGKSDRSPKFSNFSKGVSIALEKGEFLGEYEDWQGKAVIGCCKLIPSLGAVLVSEVNYSMAIRSARRDVLQIALLLTISIAGIAVLFYFFLKKALMPVIAISQAAQAAAEGNLSVRVKTKGADQIASLASSFNTMVSKLAENLHEIASSDEKRKRLIERANDGFITIDKFGNLVDVNPIVTKLWKWTQFELKSMLVFDLFEKESAKLLGKHLRRIENHGVSNLLQLSARKKTGEGFPVEVSLITLGDGTSLAIVRDISEKKILERELIQAQKLESVATLAAGIAHDFDNILVGVLGAASFLKSSTQTDDPRYEMLEVIESSSERAAALVKQLMTFARQEPPHRELISISDVVGEVLHILRSGDNPSITFRTRIPSNLPRILADAVQIRQTMFNLCINAIDSMPEGGELTVEISDLEVESIEPRGHNSLSAGRYIEIAVSDTGAGIPENELGRIFEPFYTTKPPGKGTGLGLSISHGIIESHAGTIIVDSTVGIGSTFRVYIPVFDSKEFLSDSSQPTILIADADPSIRRLYGFALESSGFNILSYSSIETAILEMKRNRNRVDILLVGASLLDKDYEAIMFRISSEMPTAKTIILGTNEKVLTDNAELVVTQPYSVKEVMQFIDEYISENKAT